MKKALCFALNEVHGPSYGGWQGWLKNPVNDGRAIAALTARAGFTSTAVFSLDCTLERLRAEFAQAAAELVAGDFFLFFFSGHGGQSPSWSFSGYKETLCLSTGELADNALREMFAQFMPGVRIMFLSDSCHSGGMSRASPAIRAKPDFVKSTVAMPALDPVDVAAGMMLVAACQASELASDGAGNNGEFTSALLDVADGFEARNEMMTCDGWATATQRLMANQGSAQHPIHEKYGALMDWGVDFVGT